MVVRIPTRRSIGPGAKPRNACTSGCTAQAPVQREEVRELLMVDHMGPPVPALVALAALALAAAGCGEQAPTPLAEGCTANPDGIVEALRTAPGPVLLEDGSRLSRCVADGTDEGELLLVGVAFSRAAERLRETAETDPEAALRLGYLVGATQKGATRTNGVMAELVRRIEVAAGRTSDDASPAAQRALERGLQAGGDVG